MKTLLLACSAILFIGCVTMSSTQRIKKKKLSKLVVFPFGEHNLLMAMKDSAFVNNCLMSDSEYYQVYLKQDGYNKDGSEDHRKIISIPDLSKVMGLESENSTSTFLICVDKEGIPKFSKFLNTTSKDKNRIRNMHHLTLQYRYEKRTQDNCLKCGRFTFKLGISGF